MSTVYYSQLTNSTIIKFIETEKKLCLWTTGEPREARAQKPGAEGGGAPELRKFLLIMTVYCIEMYYLSLYAKDKKTFLFIGTATCFRIQQP